MSAPLFRLSASRTPGLYWLQETLPTEYGIALLTAAEATTVESIDLVESWTAHPGLYLMTATRPAPGAEGAFAARARSVWGWLGAQARFLWLTDTTGDVAGWLPQAIQVAQPAGAASGTLVAPARLAFGQYALALQRGMAVAPTADGFALSGGSFSLTTPGRSWPLTGGSGTVLPFAGAGAGCLNLSLTLPGAPTAPDDYERLDVGLRMAVEREAPNRPAGGLLGSLRYPLFGEVPEHGVGFDGAFDPARPTDPLRSRLAFTTAAEHASHYRSPRGYPVALTPVPAAGDPLPAGLAFHRCPSSNPPPPASDPLYLAPIGRYDLRLHERDLCLAGGLSGYESFAAEEAEGAAVVFEAGGPAYAAGLLKGEGEVVLEDAATCPYARVASRDAKPVLYSAQPRRGALHKVRSGGEEKVVPYLVYLDVPAAEVASAPPGSYPLLPYAGAVGETAVREKLEAQALVPRRRAVLAELPPAPATGSRAVKAATPRGLLAGFGAGLTTWSSLQLAAAAPGEPPPLELHSLREEPRNAFLSEELFLVVADPACLTREADFNYRVTEAAVRALGDLPSDPPSAAVLAALEENVGEEAAGRGAFKTLLGSILPGEWTQWEGTILDHCAYFEIDIEGWRFALAPQLWSGTVSEPVLMIVKFASRSLRELAADPGSWTWQEAAKVGGKVEPTAAALRKIVDDAGRRYESETGGKPSPLEFFVRRVLDDPSWNGVLFLNPLVALDDLPMELRGLAAGIDAERFRAHHIGATISPVKLDPASHQLTLEPTPMFGLIDYEDPEDVQHTFDDFEFKVLTLRVLFENSAIADFSSRIELFVNRLFGDGVQLLDSTHYNNLILDGSYQRTPGGGHYVFVTGDVARFESQSPVLKGVEVDVAQFSTLAAGREVQSRFTLWGKLRFELLQGFDLFSFGPVQPSPAEAVVDGWLSFSGFAVDMTFRASEPQRRAFTADVGSIAFDAASSRPREESLFRRFPLQAAGMIRAEPGTKPRDLGFLALHTPLPQPALEHGWHALLFTIDLGSLGALAADAGFSATLLAAWGGAGDGLAVNAALKLPGVDSPGKLLPLEGILDMGFGALDLRAEPALSGGPAYVLRMQRFYLRLLGWQFPPGQADITLFGDPDVANQPVGGRRGSLGWYAAYKAPERKG